VRFQATGWRQAASIGSAAALLVGGCIFGSQAQSVPEYAAPTVIGVVASAERRADQRLDYRLTSGVVVTVDPASADIVQPDGGPGVGWLFLSGLQPSGRLRVVGLPPYEAADAPSGCFRLEATGVGRNGAIDLSIGFRLPKAATFDPGPISNDQYVMERVAFCINSSGEVLSYG
jgi:hypothetical protein